MRGCRAHSCRRRRAAKVRDADNIRVRDYSLVPTDAIGIGPGILADRLLAKLAFQRPPPSLNDFGQFGNEPARRPHTSHW